MNTYRNTPLEQGKPIANTTYERSQTDYKSPENSITSETSSIGRVSANSEEAKRQAEVVLQYAQWKLETIIDHLKIQMKYGERWCGISKPSVHLALFHSLCPHSRYTRRICKHTFEPSRPSRPSRPCKSFRV